ncbi:DJ-1/PfpI family protein [Dinghuibacter silviterrae]|uniref:DJ-1/PfpI family protein n=1 Tax=Dinghuibacter silviterrae TaxID=1539049 RepID=A0A4R8DQ41_9BACT|nr:DJ-1/PfpI family protein [Dinghuibacter silviterrae]TDW99524.1 DJ-1/PfpI family protein [Dinghuibacter silviterrae]
MRKKTCYVFLTEEYADYEIALVMAGLHSFGGVEVMTFALTREPVSSMGNLAVLPDYALNEVDPSDVDLLLLPGSPLWEQGANQEIAGLVRSVYLLDRGIAAICGATVFLAREGYLDNCWHTSNFEGYLATTADSYGGEVKYTGEPAVRDGQLITAGGVYGFQFAVEVFDFLGLRENPGFQEWLQYFHRGEEVIRRSRAILF